MTAAITRLSKQQQRALAQMGVDVWVRRVPADATVTPALSVAESRPQSVQSVPPTPVVGGAPVTPAAPGPIVALDCLAAPGIVIVGELVDPLDRRIAQDILLAVAGIAAPPHRAAFRWPVTQTGDASLAAARNAYRGFLAGQTERATARWLLLLGAAATALIDADAVTADAAPSGLQTLRLPAADALRADPIAKQRLWLSVSQNGRP